MHHLRIASNTHIETTLCMSQFDGTTLSKVNLQIWQKNEYVTTRCYLGINTFIKSA